MSQTYSQTLSLSLLHNASVCIRTCCGIFPQGVSLFCVTAVSLCGYGFPLINTHRIMREVTCSNRGSHVYVKCVEQLSSAYTLHGGHASTEKCFPLLQD